MQVRGLLIAIVVLALLAGGVYWSDRQKTADEAKEASGGATKLVQVASDDVRKLEIQRREAPPVVLERDKSNQWQMSAPETWRVDQDAVTEVAGSYAGLTYDRVLEENAADLANYGLAAPAVILTATAKDGKSGKLLIGDESPTGTGVFAKLANDPRVFLVTSAVKTSIDKSPADLRDKRLLVFDAGKLTRVELTSRGGAVEFGRNAQNEWQIVRPRPLRADNGKVEELVQKLGDTRMEATGTPEEAARMASNFVFGSRVGMAAVTDASGTHTLEVRKKGEEYFARSSGVAGVFKIANDAGEGLNRSLDDFRSKRIFDFGFNELSSVSIRNNDKNHAFRKAGENWTNAAGKQMDVTSVQSMIDKLRDLTATNLLETGFTAPVMEVSVTWGGGKRSEKALIAKSGDRYLAQRENEPAIYQLDSTAVEELQRAAGDVKEPPPPPKK